MTTMQEDFEVWAKIRGHLLSRHPVEGYLDAQTDAAWVAWQAAHLAGQRAMQERAAELCEQFSLAVLESEWANGYAAALKDAACGTRALEVKP